MKNKKGLIFFICVLVLVVGIALRPLIMDWIWYTFIEKPVVLDENRGISVSVFPGEDPVDLICNGYDYTKNGEKMTLDRAWEGRELHQAEGVVTGNYGSSDYLGGEGVAYKTYYWAYSIRLPEGTADTYRIFPASDYEPSACIRTGDEISFTYYKDQKGDLVIDEYHCPREELRLQAWIDALSDESLQTAGLK